MIPVPATPPPLPRRAACAFGRPVQAYTLALWGAHAAHLVGARLRRAAHLHIAQDESVTPLEASSPIDISESWSLRWLSSPRAAHVLLVIRYTASRTTARLREAAITAELSAGGVLIDKGIAWTEVQLEHEDGVTPGLYPLRRVTTGVRLDPTAGVERTTPRLLNVGGSDGEVLDLLVDADDARIASITVWEAVLPEIEQVPS